uniref:Protein BPS1, chloroplastic n=1 Tax=Kalanchoe fedtschenkoi TaxID=63787 RepID=A0A7N0T4W5_KALFE
MSRAQEPHRSFLPFGNPFKRTSPKGSYLSPRLIAILNSFEDRLTLRLRKLKPTNKNDILSLSWMNLSMELLCETHNDIIALISDLELPVSDWESKWIDVYLYNSMTLLDICNTFTSEISRLNQGHLILQCALLKLGSESSVQFARSLSFLDQWKQLVSSKNPKVENCTAIMTTLIETLELPKVKNSAKGKVLMCAMYGLKTMTVSICSVFAAGFMSSSSKLIDLHVPDTLGWAEAFTDLQTTVNREIRNQLSNGTSTVLKELEAVESVIKKLHPMIHHNEGLTETESLQSSIADLKTKSEQFVQGLNQLTKGVDSFFRVVLTGRDTLLCSIKSNSTVFGSTEKCGLDKKSGK